MFLDCAGSRRAEGAAERSTGEARAFVWFDRCLQDQEGAIPRCCKFHKRSREAAQPTAPERERDGRTWTIEKFRN